MKHHNPHTFIPHLPDRLPSQATIGQHIVRAIISILAMTTVTFSVYNMVMTAIHLLYW